jgi:hypothetical protein
MMVSALALGQVTSVWADRAREASVCYSDGTVLTGTISLTEGRTLKLTIPQAGSIKTTDMITGEDVQYGKARTFGLDAVQTIEFVPEKEEMGWDWKFTEKLNVDKDGWKPAAKEFTGPEYPLRYVKARVTMTSGEKIEGHLYTVTLYLEQKDSTRKIVLRSKERGEKEQSLEDLVYVTRIAMRDKGRDAAARVAVVFKGTKFASGDAVSAVTRETLTPVTVKIEDGNDVAFVESAFGQAFYLATRTGGRYQVGWPDGRSEEMWSLVEDHLKRQRDFYNEKTLLGVMLGKDDGEILSLVNLRRKVSPTNFGKVGGEWDKESGGVVEPWRLSIWRWKYDKENRELALIARGTFFRLILKPQDPTPAAILSTDLWALSGMSEAAEMRKDPNRGR